jgi:hypothetical protein
MTPEQKIKWLILNRTAEWEKKEHPYIDESNIEKLWADLVEQDAHWDGMNEVRNGEVETEIESEWSRHYESQSVASKAPDGTWVGWTYWYGGGKHAEPEMIKWMNEAYNLDCVEEEKVVTIREFTKID